MIQQRAFFHWCCLALFFLLVASGITVGHTQKQPSPIVARSCNYATDLLVQVREQAHPNADRKQIEHLSRLLDQVTSQCSSLGDAWYYRYLCARQLGKTQEADFYLHRAEQFDSEALRHNETPFAPATVSANGSDKVTDKLTSNVPSYVREKWALVIGISKFRDEKNIPELDYPAKDAEDFAKLLTDPSYGRFKDSNVALLTNEKATTVEIKRQIEALIGQARPDDLVVFFLSSHGSPRESSKTGVNYVVTYDTEVSSLYATSLSMVGIVDDLDKLVKAQRVVIFLDTCYSGAAGLADAFRARRSNSEEVTTTTPTGNSTQGEKRLKPEGQGVSADILNRIGQSVGRVIITASQSNEISYESKELKNGIFTYYLVQALKQNNGLSPIQEVFSYLKTEVAQRALKERSASQHPKLVTSEQQGQIDIRIGAAPKTR